MPAALFSLIFIYFIFFLLVGAIALTIGIENEGFSQLPPSFGGATPATPIAARARSTARRPLLLSVQKSRAPIPFVSLLFRVARGIDGAKDAAAPPGAQRLEAARPEQVHGAENDAGSRLENWRFEQ